MTVTDLRRAVLTRRRVAHPVPGDPDGLHVRPLTIAEGVELQRRIQAAPPDRRDEVATTWLVILSACDEAGARVLADDDYPAVAEWPVAAAEPVAELASKLNRFDRAAKDRAGNG